MMLISSNPSVVIEDGAVGWHVCVEINEDTVRHEMYFDDRGFAQAYARGLSAGGDHPLNDRSTDLPGWDTAKPSRELRVADREQSHADGEVRF